MEINFENLYRKKSLSVEFRLSKPRASPLRAVVPCNYIRLPLTRHHNRAFSKDDPLPRAIFFHLIYKIDFRTFYLHYYDLFYQRKQILKRINFGEVRICRTKAVGGPNKRNVRFLAGVAIALGVANVNRGF